MFRDDMIRWMTASGIQDANGGVHGFFDGAAGRYSYVYPEATGYFISACCDIASDASGAMDAAERAAGFLMGNMHPSGGVYQRIEGGAGRQPLYSFDTGICMNGLIELHRLSKDAKYLECAKGMGDFLIRNSSKSGIPFPAIKDSKAVIDGRWSLSYGCHLIKLCIPLYKMYMLTREEKYRLLVERILDRQLKLLDLDKFYVNSESKVVYTHANLYAMEGLAFLDRMKYGDFAGELADCCVWLASQQNDDGSMYNYYMDGAQERMKVSDATAQTVRMMICVDRKKFAPSIARGLEFLSRMQSVEEDRRSFGGLYYSHELRHVNSWATFFAAQAAYWNSSGPKPEEIF